jgi:hypothetical protein
MSAWFAWDQYDEREEISREIRLRQSGRSTLFLRFIIASIVTVAIMAILACGAIMLQAILEGRS